MPDSRRSLVLVLICIQGVAFPQGQEVTPRPDGLAHGHILGPLGNPVVAARVWAQNWKGATLVSGLTDGDGYFSLSGLEPNRGLVIRATAKGLHVGSDYYVPRRRADLGAPGLIRLYAGQAVTGSVVDAKGNPVAGATIVGWSSGRAFSASYERREVSTDQRGRFEIPKLAVGAAKISIWKSGFIPTSFDVPGPDSRYRIEHGKGVRLTVKALGIPKGHEAVVKVRFTPYRGASTPPRGRTSGLLGADRTWTSEPFAPGTHFRYIDVFSDGLLFNPVRAEARTPPYEVTVRAAVVATRPKLKVSARVMNGARPIASASVALWNQTRNKRIRTVTNEDGTFAIETSALPEDQVRVEIQGVNAFLKGHGTWGNSLLVAPDGEWMGTLGELDKATLKAETGNSLRIRLIAPDGISPLPGTWVRLERRTRAMGHRFYASGTTNQNGVVEWMGLPFPPREIRVLVSTHRYTAVATGRSGELQEIVASRAGSISGVVADAKGTPMAHKTVWLRTWDFATGTQKDGSVTPTRTDGQGRYRFIGVKPGGYFLQLMRGRDEIHRVEPFEVTAGKSVKKMIALP